MMNGDESPPPPNNNHPENFRSTHPKKGTFSIIVRDLSYFCTEEDLRNLIREVLDEDVNIYIPKSKEDDGRSLLYGFIELNSPDKVEKVQKLHGKYFMGRNLRLQPCDTNGHVHRDQHDHHGAQLHVKFEAASAEPEPLLDEESIREAFIKFGHVVDVAIKRYMVEHHAHKGYCFIVFQTFEEADFAVKSVASHPEQLPGVYFSCEYSHETKEKRARIDGHHQHSHSHQQEGHRTQQHQQHQHQQQHSPVQEIVYQQMHQLPVAVAPFPQNSASMDSHSPRNGNGNGDYRPRPMSYAQVPVPMQVAQGGQVYVVAPRVPPPISTNPQQNPQYYGAPNQQAQQPPQQQTVFQHMTPAAQQMPPNGVYTTLPSPNGAMQMAPPQWIAAGHFPHQQLYGPPGAPGTPFMVGAPFPGYFPPQQAEGDNNNFYQGYPPMVAPGQFGQQSPYQQYPSPSPRSPRDQFQSQQQPPRGQGGRHNSGHHSGRGGGGGGYQGQLSPSHSQGSGGHHGGRRGPRGGGQGGPGRSPPPPTIVQNHPHFHPQPMPLPMAMPMAVPDGYPMMQHYQQQMPQPQQQSPVQQQLPQGHSRGEGDRK